MSYVRLARRHSFQVASAAGSNFSPAGPTHQYELEVYLEGELKDKTGMVMNIRDLDGLLTEVVRPFTLKPLDISSGALAVHLCDKIRPALSSMEARLIKVRLIENPDLWFDVWA